MKKISTGIIGGAGYVGGEMIRILLGHPNCHLSFVVSQSQSGKPVYHTHPDLRGWTEITFQEVMPSEPEILFLCMGHGRSSTFLAQTPVSAGCLIIDLSRDFRLIEEGNKFVYGLCELNKPVIAQSRRIANPGCFATCIQLGLLPLADNHSLTSDVHVTAITGSTGAGQNPVSTTHHAWRNNNISVYKAFTHQHLDEIKQSMLQLQPDFPHDVHFIPMRGSFPRGIFASIYLKSELKADEAVELFQSFYSGSPFVHVSDQPISVKQVVNTNNALIYISKHNDQLRIESIIDNLLKGASGQAVQNMNIAMGWKEDAGLALKGSVY